MQHAAIFYSDNKSYYIYNRIFKKCTELKKTHNIFDVYLSMYMYFIIPDFSLSFKFNLFYIYT